ncbi:MAG: hypothetical protein GOV02_01230 [Candidatus Aenigmarchaeota archaeon]|nr:hypothetical protein [Candidatus Aenigmarchaeota archaeon]
MKKQILLGIVLGLCFVVSIGLAQSTASEAVDMYNTQLASLPDSARGFLGDENLHLYIIDGTTEEYAAITVIGVITEFEDWTDSDVDGNHDQWFVDGKTATMAVYVNMATLESINNSPNPARAFLDAWGSDIRYEGLTLGSQIKAFFMGIGMWFAGFFVPDIDVTQGTLNAVGEVCQHGGECDTGNCIYVSGEGPERTYKCSCDPMRFDTTSC